MSKALQIQPNHADHISGYREKYLKEMFENEIVVGQAKYDGERMLIHINNGEIFCTSRRFSKKTGRYMENQEKLPILKTLLDPVLDLDYTVIDCECYAKDWSTAVGILHSLPERAIELQKTDSVKFACFDCLFYNGEDLREKAYYERLEKLRILLEIIDSEYIHTVKYINMFGMSTNKRVISTYSEAMLAMEIAIQNGFEGIVIKSLNRAYYDKGASLKCKKFETLDVVVYDYQLGHGKYNNTIGALKVGYYDEKLDKIIPVSNVNCGTDEERDFWRDNWSSLKNSVIEVKCQEITEKSLRHPVYIRRRDDKDYKMCTKDTIFKN